MGTISLFFIIIYIFIDMPFLKNKEFKDKFKRLIKGLKIVILSTGLYHGIRNFLWEEQVTSKTVSGIFLLALVFAYMMSGEHSGIEDRVARKTFKTITWFILGALIFLHIFYP